MHHLFNSRGAAASRVRGISLLLALSLGAATLVGCEKPDWTNPDYVSTRLVEGDSAERAMALGKISALEDADQKKLVPALTKVYLEGDANQKDVMKRLVQLRSAEAKEAYMKEVRENSTDYAGAAAEALGEAGVTEALPDLIKLYNSTDDMDTKQGLMRAFSHMPDPQLVGLLTETMALSVDNYPIALHSYSCEILGDIGAKTPEAIDAAAKSALVRGMFLGNLSGQNVASECGIAIQQVGEPMVPLLIKTFSGENDDVKSLLAKYNKAPDYSFPENLVKGKMAVRLGSLKSQAALKPLVDDFNSVKEAPKQLSGTHAVQWRVNEARGLSETINALGQIGDASVVESLAGVVKNEKITEEWDEITDWQVELQLRQDASFALVHLGDRSATGALLEMAEKGLIVDMEKLADRAARSKQPMPMLQRYQFNWMMAESYAFLAGADGAAGLQAVIAKTKEKEIAEKMSSYIPVIEKGAECLNKGDDAAKAGCFDEMLGDKDVLVRKKAAFELSRLPAAAAAPVVAKHLADDYLESREVLTFAAYRAPSKEAIAAIDKILKDEASNGAEYKLDHHRLRLLRAWLENNTGAVAQK
ncbi:hypothetical protein [Bradymonas sediminis]|uniref:Uncharacterized protein n=1 Tax=Bradymonas sediminis TaxID=1548548 RepID=A0A2Z4FJG4_9DELT|nr:hypothetical protein [Bradymonas sediminis]AWV88990.1 hypothetical protein DN745_06400 [Bradymonas sediminis]TDP72003.1 hypothetical protein DFR33_108217 [Bradymonas sediminis]